MPRPTSQEMLKAKQRKAEREEAEMRKQAEEELAREEERAASVARLRDERRAINSLEEQLTVLRSVADTYYTEMDKLTKKAPLDLISDLSLERINKLVLGVRDMTNGQRDTFTEEIKAFVPAGRNPEYRDVLFVLGEVRAALARFRQTVANRRDVLDQELHSLSANTRIETSRR